MRKFLGCPCKSLGAAEIEGKIDGPVLPPSLLVSINNDGAWHCTVPLGMKLYTATGHATPCHDQFPFSEL